MIELSVDNTAVDPVAGSARYVAEAFSRLAIRATNEAKQAAKRNRVKPAPRSGFLTIEPGRRQ